MKKILAILAIICMLAIPVTAVAKTPDDPMDIVSAKITKKATETQPAEITITGIGFGILQPSDPFDIERGVLITANGKTVKTTIKSWTDRQIIVAAKTGIVIGIVIITVKQIGESWTLVLIDEEGND